MPKGAGERWAEASLWCHVLVILRWWGEQVVREGTPRGMGAGLQPLYLLQAHPHSLTHM